MCKNVISSLWSPFEVCVIMKQTNKQANNMGFPDLQPLSSLHTNSPFLPGLWMPFSLNWDESLPFSSNSFWSTSECLSSKEFFWRGGWSVALWMEGLWESEFSVPGSILEPKWKTFPVTHPEPEVRVDLICPPFMSHLEGCGSLLLAEKHSFLLLFRDSGRLNIGRNVADCVLSTKGLCHKNYANSSFQYGDSNKP